MTLTNSINNIINESYSLIKYLSDASISDIVNNSKIENVPYIYHFIFIFLCISSLYLIDGVYMHWKNTFQKTDQNDLMISRIESGC